jgi:site-specific DNA recombinase
MTKPRRAILYARFSPRPRARECDSIDKQLERLRAWCVAEDTQIEAEYTDEAKSGKSTDGRDGLDKAIKHACKIKGILMAYDLSRIARRALDALRIADQLRRKDVELRFLADHIDTTHKEGRFMFTIKAGMAEMIREEIAERTSMAMLAHQKAGRRMGRADLVPFGFRVSVADPKKLENDEGEQAAILRIATLRGEGKTHRAICQAMDAEGFTRRGKQWVGGHATVDKILKRLEGSE